jgi:flagellar biosynthetic protein FlhB
VMAEQDLDRNESATPFKLTKARERGQAAKSSDVVSAVVFTVAAVFLTWQGEHLVRNTFYFDQALIIQAARVDAAGAGLWPLLDHLIRTSLTLMAPLFGTLMLAGVIANIVQTGPMFSVEPLKMDWQRINPMTGFKRIFSMRTLFDAARACIKLLFLGAVAYLTLRALLPQFYGLASMSALGYMKTLLDDLGKLGFQMALILGAIALLDLLYTRHEFAKKMRMSRRELKDEIKHREGDPRIRARMRELRQQMLKKSLSLRKTRDADVLITNPTHIAVALRYVQSEMTSPQLVAKGSGKLAAAMREIAARHRIPVVQNPPLARRLFRELPVEHHVPQQMYADVARIIVWVFAMRKRQADAARGVA